MGPIEGVNACRIIELDAGDIADGLRLSTEAGWNQIAADWAMMLTVGKGFGMRDDGRLVASGIALPYRPRFGWVSMVLVTATHRHRGLATALLRHLICYLQDLDLTPMLDATPAGRAVYLPLGFRDVERIARWRSPGRPVGGQPSPSRNAFDGILRSDRIAFGADRSAILADLAGRPGAFTASTETGAFLLSRAGRTATQIGPIVAATSDDAAALLEFAIDGIAGPLLIDIPDRETVLRGLLERRGFAVERPFIRMALGRDEGFGEPGSVRAIAGPEVG
jgi:GNAT superfamily N-acetyltransferase